jgi:hypothetical protein
MPHCIVPLHMRNLTLLLLLLLASSAFNVAAAASASFRPVVLWHGMGDDCCDPRSMGAIETIIKTALPGVCFLFLFAVLLGLQLSHFQCQVYVRSLMIGANPDEDRENGFFMNVNDQVRSCSSPVLVVCAAPCLRP